MKGDPRGHWRHPSKTGGTVWHKGQALILVLAVIVLISALMVGFLIRASAGRLAAGSYSATARTRQLADVAVNLIQAQINQAITYSDTNSYAWASQPGALRVFNNSGAVDSVYRLYSAPSLISTGSTAVSSLANDVPPTTWASQSAVWTDLNAPAPVMGLTDAKGAQAIAYPILDIRNPANAGNASLPQTNSVEGFSINSAPGATSLQPAPMPVQWLYVLQNGEIVPPDSGSTGQKVTFKNATVQPSSNDPIVGRIACWTDDETCKINVNTAGADGINNSLTANNNATNNVALATFWDTPHYVSGEDSSFATNQPAKGEYQRYPGHPATTALKDVLNSIGFTNLTYAQLYGPQSGTTGYGITPRYAGGGSVDGTYGGTNSVTAISTRGDRLYPTVGEMLFNPDRTASALNNGTIQQMEPGKFFLTANSKAPEVNLFGQPRISMWPVSVTNDSNHRTPTDQLLAFCSTVGGNPYYFTRQDPKSTTTDITIARNATLLNYLDKLSSASIPGFGGNFNTKYPATSFTGATGSATSVSERQQILTEMFDYIRATNIHDSTVNNPYAAPAPTLSSTDAGEGEVLPSVNTTWNTMGFGREFKINEVSLLFVAMGSPTQPINYLNPGPWDPTITGTPLSIAGTPPSGTIAIRAFLLMSIVDPGMGFTWILPNFHVTVDGLQNLTVNDYLTPGGQRSLLFNSGAGIAPTPSMGVGAQNFGTYNDGSDVGGIMDFRFLTENHWLAYTPAQDPKNQDGLRYPFYSGIVPVPYSASAPTMNFSGGTITIYLCAPLSSNTSSYPVGIPPASSIVQTYTVNFPAGTFPVPQINSSSSVAGSADPPIIGSTVLSATAIPLPVPPALPSDVSVDRWVTSVGLAAGVSNQWIATGDVVRSMVLANGDARLLACPQVPQSAFVPTPNYASGTILQEHGYSAPAGRGFLGMVRGELAANASYNAITEPIIPSAFSSALTANGALGDWDSGVGNIADGPYIDRPDEGSVPSGGNPYQATGAVANTIGPSFFSPNRQVSSPVMFGSLPTGVIHQLPWQTLLFRPGPGAVGLTPHPGEAGRAVDGTALAGAPPDHLWLDLFWMPVCEPYAISEPFSTAGKVNLNYQIEPFTYITRSTALRAVLDSEKIAAVNTNQASNYKTTSNGINMVRSPIDLNTTLAQCDTLFASGMIYRSASQICDLFLVPQQMKPEQLTAYTSAAAFGTAWYQTGATAPYGLVGDNVRERPYAHLYSRLTTKSNTYSVHFTVQALKNTSSDPSSWTETSGTVLGEYRGTTTLERYINPNDSNLSNSANDFASNFGTSSALNLDNFYKWRIVRNEQFGP
jgi:uncharacterized protein (TIGR02600 family)